MALNSFEAKSILLLLVPLVISCLSLLIYSIFHTPSARRLLLSAFRIISVMSLSATGFAFFGWPQIEALNFDLTAGLQTKFSIRETANEVGPVLTYAATSITIIGAVYLFACWLEAHLKIEI